MIRRVGMPFVASFHLSVPVPYARDHTDPPVRREPAWPQSKPRETVVFSGWDRPSDGAANPVDVVEGGLRASRPPLVHFGTRFDDAERND